MRDAQSLECWGLSGDPAIPPAGVFEQVSADRRGGCAVAADGAVRCFGDNDVGHAWWDSCAHWRWVPSRCSFAATTTAAGGAFTITGTPASVDISVDADDGSWTGSVKEGPIYERPTVCGTLCAPGATVTVPKQ
jgi:hypothetical protein